MPHELEGASAVAVVQPDVQSATIEVHAPIDATIEAHAPTGATTEAHVAIVAMIGGHAATDVMTEVHALKDAMIEAHAAAVVVAIDATVVIGATTEVHAAAVVVAIGVTAAIQGRVVTIDRLASAIVMEMNVSPLQMNRHPCVDVAASRLLDVEVEVPGQEAAPAEALLVVVVWEEDVVGAMGTHRHQGRFVNATRKNVEQRLMYLTSTCSKRTLMRISPKSAR